MNSHRGAHVRQDALESESRKPSLLKRALILVGIFVALQAVFFACNVCASALPKDTIIKNIEASSDSALAQYFDYSHDVLGSSVSFDNNRFIEAFANQDDYDGDPVKASSLNMIEYTMPGTAMTFEYFRYWHGWQLPVFLLLMIGGLDFVGIVFGLFALASAVFFFIQMRHYMGNLPSAVFCLLAFFSTNILGNFMGDLLLSLSISMLILLSAVALNVGRNLERGIFWQDCIILISACLFCYFDFFTIPSFAIAFAVFSAMLASGCLKANFKQAVFLFIRFSAIFLLGFVLTWAMKWAIAAMYLGFPFVIANVFGEIGMWTNQSSDNPGTGLRDRFPRAYALAGSAWRVINNGNPERPIVWNIAGILGFAIFMVGVVMAVISIVRSKREGLKISGGVWALLLPALIVPLAIVVMYHHVIFHVGIFGYKPWAFFFADIACIGFYLFTRSRKNAMEEHAISD